MECPENLQMLGANKTITIDALTLVSPQLNKVVRLLDGFLVRLEHTLHDIGQVTHIEFVVEVNGSLLESALHLSVQLQGSLDHDGNQLLHRRLILAEVLVEEGTEDGKERLRLGELDSAQEEVTLQARVNRERTGSGVHGSAVHGALDLLDGELCAIIPMLVVLVLTHEGDGRLGVVLIEGGHVKIIDEVDELELADGTVDLTGSALKLLLEDHLEQHGVSVIVEVDNLLKVVLSSGRECVEETLGDLGLTATG